MNLIICCTPLQVLIAEKIIDLHPNEKFYGLMIAPIDNEKYRFYSEKLKEKCHQFKYFIGEEIKTKRNIFKFSFELIKRGYYFRCLKFSKIFMANTEKYIVRLIVNQNPNAEIYTFDDGARNLLSNNIRNIKKNIIINKMFNFLIGIGNITNESIIKKSKLHFTLYKELKNIISKTFYINIFSSIEINNRLSTQESIKIFLGQRFYADNNENIELIKKIIDIFNINFYFPHPAETYLLNNVKYIQSELIFEDYFVKNLINKNCEIYSFFSTSLLNLPKSNNIKIISLKPKKIENTFLDKEIILQTYDVLNSINLKIIEF